MNKFLESSCSVAIWAIAILELLICGFLVYRFLKTKSKLTILTACITFGLFYDAFIIALGAFIDPSKVVFISQMRFILHGILIPLLFPICVLSLELKKPWDIVIYLVTLALMIGGLAEALCQKLGPVTIGGLTRMASIKGLTPAWAETFSLVLSIGSVVPLMIAGIFIWKKEKTPFLFLSGLFMFGFSAAGAGFGDYMFYITMYGELLMVIFLVLYIFKKEKKLL